MLVKGAGVIEEVVEHLMWKRKVVLKKVWGQSRIKSLYIGWFYFKKKQNKLLAVEVKIMGKFGGGNDLGGEYTVWVLRR